MLQVRPLLVVPLIPLISVAAIAPAWAQPALPARPQEMTVVELVRAVENSIVRIDMTGIAMVPDMATNTLIESEVDATLATGFVIQTQSEGDKDLDVYIVTNEHVVAWDPKVYKGKPVFHVKPCTGVRLPASLVGIDAMSDLAVLKVRVPSLAKGSWRALSWSPGTTQVGEDVIAVGFGQGLRGAPSVTKGIVSATNRFHREPGRKNGRFAGLIQTDATINPGNSGGPLVNLRGEVVGVNTLQHFVVQKDPATGSEAFFGPSAGIYYARSSVSASGIVHQLMLNGHVFRPATGLWIRTLTEAESHKKGGTLDCVEVESVEKDSPAALAGIEPGDLIGSLSPEPPRSPINFSAMLLQAEGDWHNALARCTPNKPIYLFVLRKKDGFAKGEYVAVQPSRP